MLHHRNDPHVETKIKEYKSAIEKYKNIPWYVRVEMIISILVIFLQFFTLVHLCFQYQEGRIIYIFGSLIAAYILTDFVNGLVHMIVDNSQQYSSLTGPFIAAFHLHHVKLNYETIHPIKIYFYESGHKFWLAVYLALLLILQMVLNLNFCLNLCLVAFGILSSVAELSHFWCHNQKQTNRFIRFLQKYRLLLSMHHHQFHHKQDNTHYAFLNGVTDPLLNMIAKHFFTGYKNFSDKHVSAYHLGR